MKEYEYVKIDLPCLCFSGTAVDYHDIIEDYARAGWLLRQIFLPPNGLFRRAKFLELIFERDFKPVKDEAFITLNR